MEQVGKTVGEISSHTLLDKFRFFELAVFNFIIGNNDMHLKNFSMILSDEYWLLTPAYDLLNVKLVFPKDDEDIALMLGGKKKNQDRKHFECFASILQFNEKQSNSVFVRIEKWFPKAEKLIQEFFYQEN